MLKISVGELRKLIRESADDPDLNSIEVGDVVDVVTDEMGALTVRVLELVDDVNKEAGPPDPRKPHEYTGPGFVGKIEDPHSGESGTLVWSLNQVVPGSKAQGYFPRLGTKFDDAYTDWDDHGRREQNPYRTSATRFGRRSLGGYESGLPDPLEGKSLRQALMSEARSKEEFLAQMRAQDPQGKNKAIQRHIAKVEAMSDEQFADHDAWLDKKRAEWEPHVKKFAEKQLGKIAAKTHLSDRVKLRVPFKNPRN